MLDLDDEEVRALVADEVTPFSRLGARAPVTVSHVLERLDCERRMGYCVAIDEVETGLTSVGAPVRDSTHRIIAALNISGPTFRIAERVDGLAATASAAAQRLTTALTEGR